MSNFEKGLLDFLSSPLNVAGAIAALVILLLTFVYWEYARFMLKSLRRNLLRSALTSIAIMVLVFMVTLIWSILAFITAVTEEKSADFKLIITEKNQIPSQMPISYMPGLESYARDPSRDSMTWQFYGGNTEQKNRNNTNAIFFFCMDPAKFIHKEKNGKFTSMMDGIDEFPMEDQQRLVEACAEMAADPKKVLIGEDRLKMLDKKVGERIKVYSINYKDIDLELEILGALPAGRYGQSAVMNRSYLLNAMDSYKLDKKLNPKGDDHPMMARSLNLVWLRVPDRAEFEKVADGIAHDKSFTTVPVKCETASSGIGAFLDAYRDLLKVMRWFLAPTLLITMALVLANAISIGVRERRTEMAVLKVLGFTPMMVLCLVLGEALILGSLSGLFSAVATKIVVNDVRGGIKFPIAFFPAFRIADAAPWWGVAVGAGTAFVGSIIPAWGARSVKVSEVFAKVG